MKSTTEYHQQGDISVDLPGELWADVTGECRYTTYISNMGRVRRITKDGKVYAPVLRITNEGHGYLRIGDLHVHRAVIDSFGPPCPDPKYVVDHINQNKFDNRIGNLRWCSPSDNMRNASMKLTQVDIFDLDGNFIRTFPSINDAADFFGMSYQGISDVIRGRSRTIRSAYIAKAHPSDADIACDASTALGYMMGYYSEHPSSDIAKMMSSAAADIESHIDSPNLSSPRRQKIRSVLESYRSMQASA